MFIRLHKHGQSTAEYTILIIVILIAFWGTNRYLRRGIQGYWKRNVDGLGDQYDPTVMGTSILHTRVANTVTIINIEGDSVDDGFWTQRYDFTNIIEHREGESQTGAY